MYNFSAFFFFCFLAMLHGMWEQLPNQESNHFTCSLSYWTFREVPIYNFRSWNTFTFIWRSNIASKLSLIFHGIQCQVIISCCARGNLSYIWLGDGFALSHGSPWAQRLSSLRFDVMPPHCVYSNVKPEETVVTRGSPSPLLVAAEMQRSKWK